jgi:Zn-dependent protease
MRSWRIGSAFGIGLYVHWSFLLLPAIVGWYKLSHDGLDAAMVSVVAVFALLGCVMLHELGHSLMARVYGVNTRDITMYPIGGIARLERMPERPIEELFIAIAGPLVNVVISLVFFGGMLLAGTFERMSDVRSGGFVDKLVSELFLMNVALVIFNMLPAFPMDGGRVLRAVLAMWIDRIRATQVAVLVASVFAVLFVGLAIFGQQPLIGLIGVLVLFLGRQELAMLRYRQGVRPAAAVVGVAEEIPTVLPVGPRVIVHVWDPLRGMWVAQAYGARGQS